MDKQKRKELLEQYKQIETQMGVVRVTNTSNGKVFVAGFPNLKNKWHTMKGQLDMGQHPNSALQRDWKVLGPESFTYEVLEEKGTGDISDVAWEVKRMERAWLERLQPYGDKGYNRQSKEEI